MWSTAQEAESITSQLAPASLTAFLPAVAETRLPHTRYDRPRARMRFGYQPKRQRERQGRAQCDHNGLKLGRVHQPLSNEKWLRLARNFEFGRPQPDIRPQRL
jgi:hypothetical protein